MQANVWHVRLAEGWRQQSVRVAFVAFVPETNDRWSTIPIFFGTLCDGYLTLSPRADKKTP
ncbi:hypothetical protein EMIT043CA1_60075 [Pseudomonas brassicacearum]